MGIVNSTIAQVSSHGAGWVRVKTVHMGSDNKKYTLRRKALEGDDHEAHKPQYAAIMLLHMQRGEVGQFYKHLTGGFTPGDFTRHHATQNQMRNGILRLFVRENHPLKAARVAVWINAVVTDQHIADSGLNSVVRANIRPRANNIEPVVATLALDQTYIRGQG